MYDPTIGRWTSKDPLGFEAGDTNLYRYVENNPTNLTDPSGLQAEPKYDPKDFGKPIIVITDKNKVQLVIFPYLKNKDNPYFFGVVYQPGKLPEIFGKCRYEPAFNIQIPYYQKDNRQNPLVKILWINIEAKTKGDRDRIAKSIATALQTFPDGGDRLKTVIDFILKREVNSLVEGKRTDYEWRPDKDTQITWPKDDPKPPIPPQPKPENP